MKCLKKSVIVVTRVVIGDSDEKGWANPDRARAYFGICHFEQHQVTHLLYDIDGMEQGITQSA